MKAKIEALMSSIKTALAIKPMTNDQVAMLNRLLDLLNEAVTEVEGL